MELKKILQEFLEESCITTSVEEYLKGREEELDNLTYRLQQDYNIGDKFIQQEEDRLATYDMCNLLEFLIEKIEEEKGDKLI